VDQISWLIPDDLSANFRRFCVTSPALQIGQRHLDATTASQMVPRRGGGIRPRGWSTRWARWTEYAAQTRTSWRRVRPEKCQWGVPMKSRCWRILSGVYRSLYLWQPLPEKRPPQPHILYQVDNVRTPENIPDPPWVWKYWESRGIHTFR